jgi:hypothetical protein
MSTQREVNCNAAICRDDIAVITGGHIKFGSCSFRPKFSTGFLPRSRPAQPLRANLGLPLQNLDNSDTETCQNVPKFIRFHPLILKPYPFTLHLSSVASVILPQLYRFLCPSVFNASVTEKAASWCSCSNGAPCPSKGKAYFTFSAVTLTKMEQAQ